MIILLLHYRGISQGSVFGLVLDFTGGFVGSITSFIIPGCIYLKAMKSTEKFYYPCIAMVLFGTFVAIYVPVISVIFALQSSDDD